MNERGIEVLQKYDLEISGTRRGRGAILCETDKGLKLLKEYRGTAKRLDFEDEVLRQLCEQGYPYVDRYVRNKDDEILTSENYILKNWFDDRECDVKDSKEIMKAVTQLAVLHQMFQKIETQEGWNMGSIAAPSLLYEYERHNKELKRVRSYIRNKRKKSEFELCVMNNFNQFYRQAEDAYKELENLTQKEGTLNTYLCHGNYSHHHILMGSKYIAITEFTKMHLDIQMTDLYYFIRKIMEKHNWNLKIGVDMLEAYGKILPLSKDDRKYLYYLFLYPEKYWKQINFYYNANKAWIPSRNIEKLKNLEEQFDKRELFLKEIY